MLERRLYRVVIVRQPGLAVSEQVLVRAPGAQRCRLARRGDHGVIKAKLGFEHLQLARSDLCHDLSHILQPTRSSNPFLYPSIPLRRSPGAANPSLRLLPKWCGIKVVIVMKKPSAAARKKVNAENLVGLGAERLADILVSVASTRPDLKRRLRMELAAEQGPAHLAAEIDKRLGSLETSRSRISWRQRPAVVRDLVAMRELIADRLAGADRAAALHRLWRFLAAAGSVSSRSRGNDEAAMAVFERAAADLGGLLVDFDPHLSANTLVDAIADNPTAWKIWAPFMLASAPRAVAQSALALISERTTTSPGWMTVIRHLADSAGDADIFRSTYSADALRAPAIASEVASRYLAAGRVEDAGDLLRAAAPALRGRQGRLAAPDYAWESQWIDYLEGAGRREEAQAVRWASFERTLSSDRLRAFTGRLADFDDVEAEARAFVIAAAHSDFEAGLRLLIDWPALSEAGRMILARPDDVDTGPEDAELWAAKLRRRQPGAAHLLLRKAATAAFRRRDFKTCDRLTEEADTIDGAAVEVTV
jgi:hypothetical protein